MLLAHCRSGDAGIFGDYIKDGIIITAQNTTAMPVVWTEASAGVELWRIGSECRPFCPVENGANLVMSLVRTAPDKSAGEFKHGYARDPNRSLHPEEYRSYWGAWDFTKDFPSSVNYTIGESNPAQDWVRPFATGLHSLDLARLTADHRPLLLYSKCAELRPLVSVRRQLHPPGLHHRRRQRVACQL